MLDLDQINNTIEELENGATTFDTCLKLSSLYIVREHLENATQTMVSRTSSIEQTEVERELADILPHYQKYCEVKRSWQTGNGSQSNVIDQMKFVCIEIQEFINTLYSGTDMPEERTIIQDMCFYLYNELS